MGLEYDSIAAAVGAGVKNKQFVAAAENVPRKIVIIGQQEYPILAIPDNVPRKVSSPEEVAALTGRGYMLHRLAMQVYRGSQGIETWIVPQSTDTGVAANGDVNYDTSAPTESGYIYLYIAGELVKVAVVTTDTPATLASKTAAAINANKDLPVSATAATTIATITAKSSANKWGDHITVRLNIKAGESLPAGVVVALPAGEHLTGGTQIIDIQPALDSLGEGEDANSMFFTDMAYGYHHEDASSIDKISAYVGPGNDFTGLYSKEVARPFRALTGDIVFSEAQLAAYVDLRKEDRANGIIAAPTSASHPCEIAAQAIGHMARINQVRAAENYINISLIGIDPGSTNRWTNSYDSRDDAVRHGVSPTRYKNGVLVLQNIVTFYHPDDVPLRSNGYASMRNISILQNTMDNIRANFDREKWRGISIVEDITKVASDIDKEKARDVDTVLDDLVKLARVFESKAWLFTADYTIERLKDADSVSIRPGGTGFDMIFKVVLSGEGLVFDTVTEFDINIGVIL